VAGETVSLAAVCTGKCCVRRCHADHSPVELRVSVKYLLGSVQYEVALSGHCLFSHKPRSVRAVKFSTVSRAATGLTLVARYDELSVC
jgi:hypothetical protein